MSEFKYDHRIAGQEPYDKDSISYEDLQPDLHSDCDDFGIDTGIPLLESVYQSETEGGGARIDKGQHATPGLFVSKESSLRTPTLDSRSGDSSDFESVGRPISSLPSGSRKGRFGEAVEKADAAALQPKFVPSQIGGFIHTPLAMAIEEGRQNMLESLLRVGDNNNAHGRTDSTALEVAAQSEDQVAMRGTADNTTMILHGVIHIFDDSDDDRMSTYAESVFFSGSIGSSATGLSATSAYTDAEIVTATRELINIFIEDKKLRQLYQHAFDDPRIGPDRLKRNLYRLLKKYAQNLQQEAKGELKRLAAQLLAVKARYVMQCVMEKFYVKSVLHRQHGDAAEGSKDDSEEEDAEEDDDLPAIDEDRF